MINDLWYKNAVIYCLSIATYLDTNGDGIGDFQGLMRRLDYLQGLGVTAIWLMPFQPSPGRDDGYDVADYYGVNSRYGTLGDFVEFTHGCRQRGLRVLIDLVVNHTSDQHPWFQEARRDPSRNIATGMCGQRRSQRMQRRVWSFQACRRQRGPTTTSPGPTTSIAFMIFNRTSIPPTPKCRRRSSRSWGFGCSLASRAFAWTLYRLSFPRKEPWSKPEEDYEMLRTFSQFLGWREGDAIILGEANVLPDTDMHYFGSAGERVQMMFNFEVNQHLFLALATADCRSL